MNVSKIGAITLTAITVAIIELPSIGPPSKVGSILIICVTKIINPAIKKLVNTEIIAKVDTYVAGVNFTNFKMNFLYKFERIIVVRKFPFLKNSRAHKCKKH